MPVEEPLRPAFFAVPFFAAPFFVRALRGAGDFLADFFVVFLAADFFAANLLASLWPRPTPFWVEVYKKQRFPGWRSAVDNAALLLKPDWNRLTKCRRSIF